MDLGLSISKSGKPNYAYVRDLLLPVVSELQPGDRLFFNGKVLKTVGECISALSSWYPSKCYFPDALRSQVEPILNRDEEEIVRVIAITDKYEDWKEHIILQLDALDQMNKYWKDYKLHLWTIKARYKLPDNAVNFEDVSELTEEKFKSRFFS